MAEERRERRGGGLVGPILLIALGILFLLSNLGLLPWSIWEVIFRLWPVALIALGLDILFGRGSVLASLLIALLVLGIVGASLLVFVPQSAGGGAQSNVEISQPLEGAARADVEIRSGVGNLRIDSLPEGAANLAEGTVELEARERLSSDFQVRDDTAHFTLRSEGTSEPPFGSGRVGGRRWDLRLNPDVPTLLKVGTGVGTSDLDLSRLRVTEFEMDAGIGRANVTLPARGQLSARIEGGIGEVVVVIPQGMAARIQASAGLGGVSVTGDYQRQGELYVSPGYDTAENRVDLRVNGGIGQITVR